MKNEKKFDYAVLKDFDNAPIGEIKKSLEVLNHGDWELVVCTPGGGLIFRKEV